MSNSLLESNSLLVLIAVHNSESAYKQLFKFLFPSLYRFCYLLLKSRELAEEVASDVMITIWLKRKKLPEIQNIRGYAFVIARNLSINMLHKDERWKLISLDDVQVEIILNTLDPEQMLINNELRKELENAIQHLPARCKLVFKLIKENGLSYKKTAEILNISTKTVDAHLVTAGKKLSSLLKKETDLSG